MSQTRIRFPLFLGPATVFLVFYLNHSVYAGTDLVIEAGETISITNGQFDNITVNDGKLIAKGQLSVANRLRISGGDVYLEGYLDSPTARVDISSGRLVTNQTPNGKKHRAQRINIGRQGFLESSGNWTVERIAVFEQGTLQTPPGTTHRLAFEADSFTVTKGALVHLTGNCGDYPYPIDGSTLIVAARTLEIDGTITVKGSNGHTNVSAGDGGVVSMFAQTITSFEGHVFAGGGSTWNGTNPGQGGHIEIRVGEGSLPTDDRMSVAGGGFMGDFESNTQNGTIDIARLALRPALKLSSVGGSLRISFEQPANESFIIQRSDHIGGLEDTPVPIFVTDATPNPRRVEMVVDPNSSPTSFYRLIRNPAIE